MFKKEDNQFFILESYVFNIKMMEDIINKTFAVTKKEKFKYQGNFIECRDAITNVFKNNNLI